MNHEIKLLVRTLILCTIIIMLTWTVPLLLWGPPIAYLERYAEEGCMVVSYNATLYSQPPAPDLYVQVYAQGGQRNRVLVFCPRETARAIKFRVEHPERFEGR